MNKFFFFIINYCLVTLRTAAQSNDTLILPKPDTASTAVKTHQSQGTSSMTMTDSFSTESAVIGQSQLLYFTKPFTPAYLTKYILQQHPYFGFGKDLTIPARSEIKRERKGKELLFYFIIFLLLIYGLLKMAFPKYFSDLFRLFFRTTLKQRQIKEQLKQNLLPSLLLNFYFVLSAGFYISLVLQHYNINPFHNNWKNFIYAGIGLSIIYFVKYSVLKITGWLFATEEAAESYIFIVFMVNKMLGLLLLPFIILLAFSTDEIYTFSLVVSWCMIAVLFLYRIMLARATIHNLVKVRPFHFFLYVLAFEIAPLLLVYKAIVWFIDLSA